jgi:copper(I)-binding protein
LVCPCKRGGYGKVVKRMLKFYRVLAAGLGLILWGLAAGGLAAGEHPLVFDSAWVRALPPGMGMTAGYGTIINSGAEPLEITVFSSPQFAEVSLHRTETVDGVSRMHEVPALRVEAGAVVELAPGGYHLMLMKPSAPLATGQTVTVRMTTTDGRDFEFEVPVERR